jgi:phytoene dehydrogenase-like protein
VRLAAAGHGVTVLEQGATPGGKAGRLELRPPGAPDRVFRFDTGPSLLTMPWVVRSLFAQTGAPAREAGVELVRVEPVTRYRFADRSGVTLSADLPSALEALEAWAPGTGTDWTRFLGVCASLWRASVPYLTGPPPWPPGRRRAGAPPPDPRDLLRVRPWHTLRGLARATVRDPRLRLVVERFATYAGADPRRAPAVLAVAGYVEHAFGAWHVRGGLYASSRRSRTASRCSAATCAWGRAPWRSSEPARTCAASSPRRASAWPPTPSSGTATPARWTRSCAATSAGASDRCPGWP